MRPGRDGRLWGFAIAASIGIHAALGAGLLALPSAQVAHDDRTAVGLAAAPGGLAAGVAARRIAEPAAPESAVAEAARRHDIAEAARPASTVLNPAADSVEARAAATDTAALAVPAAPAVAAAPAVPERTSTLAAAELPGSEARQIATEPPAASASARAAPASISPVISEAAPAAEAVTAAEAAAAAAAPVPSAAERPPPAPQAVGRIAGRAVPVPGVSRPASSLTATPARPALAPVATGSGAQAAAPTGAGPAGVAAAAPAPPAAEIRPSATSPGLLPVPQASGDTVRPSVLPSPARPAARLAPSAAASREVVTVAPVEDAGDSGAAPATGGGEGAEEVAALTPRIPTAPRAEERPDPFAAMLDFLSTHQGGRCFLALAAGGGGPLGIDGFSAAPAEVERLGEDLRKLVGLPVEARAHEVTAQQCGALSFARRLPGYPLPALDIRPEVRTIESGAYLSGRIREPKRKWLYLLLVDDEGKVEEIQDLFQEAGGSIGFSAPMTLKHGPVSTVQILVALASDEPLETVTEHDGEQADAYFAALADEIARANGAVDFGLTYFFVR